MPKKKPSGTKEPKGGPRTRKKKAYKRTKEKRCAGTETDKTVLSDGAKERAMKWVNEMVRLAGYKSLAEMCDKAPPMMPIFVVWQRVIEE